MFVFEGRLGKSARGKLLYIYDHRDRPDCSTGGELAWTARRE